MYKYNPFLVLNYQSQPTKAGMQAAQQSEPILYDPVKQGVNAAGVTHSVKNVAKHGSLLKVWEG